MNSTEKIDRMYQLIAPKDRSEIPVFPLIICWAGKAAGISQAEIVGSNEKWQEALDATFALVGTPDVSLMNSPGDIIFIEAMKAKVPGRELGDEELFQLIEYPAFEADEYSKILEMGWQSWFASYMMGIQSPAMTDPQQLYARYGKLAADIASNIQFLLDRGIEPCFHTAQMPIYDALSLIRSMGEFAIDLFEAPGIIVDIISKAQPIDDEQTISMLKQSGGTRVGMYPMRSCAPFVSPQMFEELIWPIQKASILRFVQAGLHVTIHADSDWLPMLEFYTQLPKASIHFEFDGVTDLFKAYEIIGGWHSFCGDVPSTMLAFGSADEVSAYCEKLINGIGMKGGFMLGSGCEVPLNAKPENVKALIESVR